MLDDVLRKFKTSHRSILETIDQLRLTLRNYPKAKPVLRQLHQQLLTHLGRQNSTLFASLKDFYLSKREAEKLIDFLEFDLKETKVKFMVFYDEHSGAFEDSNARSFSRDFGDFSALIRGRIKMEEDYLIPLLEKLPQ